MRLDGSLVVPSKGVAIPGMDLGTRAAVLFGRGEALGFSAGNAGAGPGSTRIFSSNGPVFGAATRILRATVRSLRRLVGLFDMVVRSGARLVRPGPRVLRVRPPVVDVFAAKVRDPGPLVRRIEPILGLLGALVGLLGALVGPLGALVGLHAPPLAPGPPWPDAAFPAVSSPGAAVEPATVTGGAADLTVAGRCRKRAGGGQEAAGPNGPPRASRRPAPTLTRFRGPARNSRREHPDPGAASSFYVAAVPLSPARAPDLRPAARCFPAAQRPFPAAPPWSGVAGP